MAKINSELPKYRVILRNDEVNSLGKVVTALMILGNKPVEEAIQLAAEINIMGAGIVACAHFELAETIDAKLKAIGLDSFIEKDLI